jgi:hypothetical protein
VVSSTTERVVAAPPARFTTARRLGFAELFEMVAQGEAERERSGRPPYDEVRP